MTAIYVMGQQLLHVYHAILGKSRKYTQDNCYFGAEFSESEIEKFLKTKKVKYQKIINKPEYLDRILDEGRDFAISISSKKIALVKEKIGLSRSHS